MTIEPCVVLFGRVLLPDGRERDCQLRFGIRLRMWVTPGSVPEGARLIFHVGDLGVVEGIAGPLQEPEQTVAISGTASHLAKLSARIEWHRRQPDVDEEQRRHARIVPASKAVRVRLSCGIELAATLIDLSANGAALRLRARPDIGSPIVIGRRHGKVVRHLEDGTAVAFNLPLRPQDVTSETIL